MANNLDFNAEVLDSTDFCPLLSSARLEASRALLRLCLLEDWRRKRARLASVVNIDNASLPETSSERSNLAEIDQSSQSGEGNTSLPQVSTAIATTSALQTPEEHNVSLPRITHVLEVECPSLVPLQNTSNLSSSARRVLPGNINTSLSGEIIPIDSSEDESDGITNSDLRSLVNAALARPSFSGTNPSSQQVSPEICQWVSAPRRFLSKLVILKIKNNSRLSEQARSTREDSSPRAKINIPFLEENDSADLSQLEKYAWISSSRKVHANDNEMTSENASSGAGSVNTNLINVENKQTNQIEMTSSGAICNTAALATQQLVELSTPKASIVFPENEKMSTPLQQIRDNFTNLIEGSSTVGSTVSPITSNPSSLIASVGAASSGVEGRSNTSFEAGRSNTAGKISNSGMDALNLAPSKPDELVPNAKPSRSKKLPSSRKTNASSPEEVAPKKAKPTDRKQTTPLMDKNALPKKRRTYTKRKQTPAKSKNDIVASPPKPPTTGLTTESYINLLMESWEKNVKPKVNKNKSSIPNWIASVPVVPAKIFESGTQFRKISIFVLPQKNVENASTSSAKVTNLTSNNKLDGAGTTKGSVIQNKSLPLKDQNYGLVLAPGKKDELTNGKQSLEPSPPNKRNIYVRDSFSRLQTIPIERVIPAKNQETQSVLNGHASFPSFWKNQSAPSTSKNDKGLPSNINRYLVSTANKDETVKLNLIIPKEGNGAVAATNNPVGCASKEEKRNADQSKNIGEHFDLNCINPILEAVEVTNNPVGSAGKEETRNAHQSTNKGIDNNLCSIIPKKENLGVEATKNPDDFSSKDEKRKPDQSTNKGETITPKKAERVVEATNNPVGFGSKADQSKSISLNLNFINRKESTRAVETANHIGFGRKDEKRGTNQLSNNVEIIDLDPIIPKAANTVVEAINPDGISSKDKRRETDQSTNTDEIIKLDSITPKRVKRVVAATNKAVGSGSKDAKRNTDQPMKIIPKEGNIVMEGINKPVSCGSKGENRNIHQSTNKSDDINLNLFIPKEGAVEATKNPDGFGTKDKKRKPDQSTNKSKTITQKKAKRVVEATNNPVGFVSKEEKSKNISTLNLNVTNPKEANKAIEAPIGFRRKYERRGSNESTNKIKMIDLDPIIPKEANKVVKAMANPDGMDSKDKRRKTDQSTNTDEIIKLDSITPKRAKRVVAATNKAVGFGSKDAKRNQPTKKSETFNIPKEATTVVEGTNSPNNLDSIIPKKAISEKKPNGFGKKDAKRKADQSINKGEIIKLDSITPKKAKRVVAATNKAVGFGSKDAKRNSDQPTKKSEALIIPKEAKRVVEGANTPVGCSSNEENRNAQQSTIKGDDINLNFMIAKEANLGVKARDNPAGFILNKANKAVEASKNPNEFGSKEEKRKADQSTNKGAIINLDSITPKRGKRVVAATNKAVGFGSKDAKRNADQPTKKSEDLFIPKEANRVVEGTNNPVGCGNKEENRNAHQSTNKGDDLNLNRIIPNKAVEATQIPNVFGSTDEKRKFDQSTNKGEIIIDPKKTKQVVEATNNGSKDVKRNADQPTKKSKTVIVDSIIPKDTNRAVEASQKPNAFGSTEEKRKADKLTNKGETINLDTITPNKAKRVVEATDKAVGFGNKDVKRNTYQPTKRSKTLMVDSIIPKETNRALEATEKPNIFASTNEKRGAEENFMIPKEANLGVEATKNPVGFILNKTNKAVEASKNPNEADQSTNKGVIINLDSITPKRAKRVVAATNKAIGFGSKDAKRNADQPTKKSEDLFIPKEANRVVEGTNNPVGCGNKEENRNAHQSTNKGDDLNLNRIIPNKAVDATQIPNVFGSTDEKRKADQSTNKGDIINLDFITPKKSKRVVEATNNAVGFGCKDVKRNADQPTNKSKTLIVDSIIPKEISRAVEATQKPNVFGSIEEKRKADQLTNKGETIKLDSITPKKAKLVVEATDNAVGFGNKDIKRNTYQPKKRSKTLMVDSIIPKETNRALEETEKPNIFGSTNKKRGADQSTNKGETINLDTITPNKAKLVVEATNNPVSCSSKEENRNTHQSTNTSDDINLNKIILNEAKKAVEATKTPNGFGIIEKRKDDQPANPGKTIKLNFTTPKMANSVVAATNNPVAFGINPDQSANKSKTLVLGFIIPKEVNVIVEGTNAPGVSGRIEEKRNTEQSKNMGQTFHLTFVFPQQAVETTNNPDGCSSTADQSTKTAETIKLRMYRVVEVRTNPSRNDNPPNADQSKILIKVVNSSIAGAANLSESVSVNSDFGRVANTDDINSTLNAATTALVTAQSEANQSESVSVNSDCTSRNETLVASTDNVNPTLNDAAIAKFMKALPKKFKGKRGRPRKIIKSSPGDEETDTYCRFDTTVDLNDNVEEVACANNTEEGESLLRSALTSSRNCKEQQCAVARLPSDIAGDWAIDDELIASSPKDKNTKKPSEKNVGAKAMQIVEAGSLQHEVSKASFGVGAPPRFLLPSTKENSANKPDAASSNKCATKRKDSENENLGASKRKRFTPKKMQLYQHSVDV